MTTKILKFLKCNMVKSAIWKPLNAMIPQPFNWFGWKLHGDADLASGLDLIMKIINLHR